MKTILGIFIICLSLHCYAKGNGDNIQSAAAIGNFEKVKKFLADKPTLLSSKEGVGTLTAAAVHGQLDMVDFLISQEADVNEKGFFKMTPLACMASAFRSNNDEKYAEIAAMLIAHGAAVDPVDDYHDTPLLHAVESENYHLAEVLVKNGADPTVRYNGVNHGTTPLHMAIRNGDTNLVAVLLKYKPTLDAVDGDGATPLLLAEQLDRTEIVAMLHQAEPQATLKTYVTPPTKEAMRVIAQRIADGDETAFDELARVANDLYGDIQDYQKEQARVMLNLFRMKAAFDLLGKEAGKGNASAFQALKKSLGVGRLSSFAPDALGIAAAAGNKEALNILLHFDNWGILESSANFALCLPAKANVEPAVDYFVMWLPNIKAFDGSGGMVLSATNALAEAAAKGNQKARDALEKFITSGSGREN
jgi:hypothetical protein